MDSNRRYSLPELMDRIGFDYDAERGKMDCPFCGKKNKMSLDLEEDTYRCPKCGQSGGVFHMFTYFVKGYELPKKSSKSLLRQVLGELTEYMEGKSLEASPPKPPKPKRPKVPVASDDQLDAVYQAMSKIPALQLTSAHRANLLARGLDNEAIDRNGYRSIPEIMPVSDYYVKLYEDAGGETRRSHEMNWLTAKQIRFGLMIAHTIISQGLDVQGVPGFFKFGIYWAYWVNPGILIPTRNIKGQIVIWQVRRDKTPKEGELRYVTSSCKRLPGHVTGSVSRCHFPLENAPVSAEAPFLITEGPLKADVACHLYGRPVTFVAIHGIQNTKDLYAHTNVLKKAGIKKIYNALDMDRLTNANVRKGSNAIVAEFKKRRIVVENMYWGTQYATTTLISLLLIANLRKVPVPAAPTDTVFDRLCTVSKALEEAKVTTLLYRDKKGNTVAWEPETKGIDDFLFHRSNPPLW